MARKKMNKKTIKITFWASALTLVFPLCQHAYLDPGTGSYLFQILLAGLLGAGMTVRIFWGRIKTFFTRKKQDPLDE
jgi:ribose/xylose/arabinose/galactoside ABC-type transport system permease subunit